MASIAMWAERFGRNPKLGAKKSASNTGSSTIFAAAITTRSETVGIPSGRVLSRPARLGHMHPPQRPWPIPARP